MPDVTVKGGPEVIAALNDVKRWDKGKAASDAADAMLPDIRRKTRKMTGDLRAGWGYNTSDTGVEFTNKMYYMGWQEFGTETIEGSFAVSKSWKKNERGVKQAYYKAINDEIIRAGLND